MHKVLVVYGTRPEAIKMAPLVAELGRSAHCTPVVAVTGQHRAMLDQVNQLFGIRPSYDLDILTARQRLEDVTSRVLCGLADVIEAEAPDAVAVQGDTTTCFAASLAAFYRKVPVIHLEAGLRTGERYNPFPEEVNRRLTTQLTTVHLAPTRAAKANLLRDGVSAKDVVVTGNTVIDALHHVVSMRLPLENSALAAVAGKRSILVTAHRRESWGAPMARIAGAVARLAAAFPDVMFVLPAHLNPAVREVLLPPLTGRPNILVTEPLCYSDFAWTMHGCSAVLTDSGGVQEEAPSLGKPVLVMRETTERPEAVSAGTVKLVGTDEDLIFAETATLLTSETAFQAMARAANPYGDGHAAMRSVQAIEHFLGLASRPSEFRPQPTVPYPENLVDGFAA